MTLFLVIGDILSVQDTLEVMVHGGTHLSQRELQSGIINILKTSLLRRPPVQTLPDATSPVDKIYPLSKIAVPFLTNTAILMPFKIMNL